MTAPACRVRIRKIKALLTRFQCVCACGWESPMTTKDKARIGKLTHEGGGEIVSWTKAEPAYVECPECVDRALLGDVETPGDPPLSELPEVCPTCSGAGKVPAEAVH